MEKVLQELFGVYFFGHPSYHSNGTKIHQDADPLNYKITQLAGDKCMLLTYIYVLRSGLTLIILWLLW